MAARVLAKIPHYRNMQTAFTDLPNTQNMLTRAFSKAYSLRSDSDMFLIFSFSSSSFFSFSRSSRSLLIRAFSLCGPPKNRLSPNRCDFCWNSPTLLFQSDVNYAGKAFTAGNPSQTPTNNSALFLSCVVLFDHSRSPGLALPRQF